MASGSTGCGNTGEGNLLKKGKPSGEKQLSWKESWKQNWTLTLNDSKEIVSREQQSIWKDSFCCLLCLLPSWVMGLRASDRGNPQIRDSVPPAISPEISQGSNPPAAPRLRPSWNQALQTTTQKDKTLFWRIRQFSKWCRKRNKRIIWMVLVPTKGQGLPELGIPKDSASATLQLPTSARDALPTGVLSPPSGHPTPAPISNLSSSFWVRGSPQLFLGWIFPHLSKGSFSL